MVPRIHIIGRKNSGKTTLIVELVRELTARGLKVGTIKHTHHHHEFDAPGKDSFLHRQAGASVVGLVGPRMVAAFREIRDSERQSQIEQIEPLFAECDIVLVEGNQQTTGRKLEVWREASGQSPLALELSGVLAVITDDPVPDSTRRDSGEVEQSDRGSASASVPCPIWPRRDVSSLADRVVSLVTGMDSQPFQST